MCPAKRHIEVPDGHEQLLSGLPARTFPNPWHSLARHCTDTSPAQVPGLTLATCGALHPSIPLLVMVWINGSSPIHSGPHQGLSPSILLCRANPSGPWPDAPSERSHACLAVSSPLTHVHAPLPPCMNASEWLPNAASPEYTKLIGPKPKREHSKSTANPAAPAPPSRAPPPSPHPKFRKRAPPIFSQTPSSRQPSARQSIQALALGHIGPRTVRHEEVAERERADLEVLRARRTNASAAWISNLPTK